MDSASSLASDWGVACPDDGTTPRTAGDPARERTLPPRDSEKSTCRPFQSGDVDGVRAALDEHQKGHAMYGLDAQMHAMFQARSASSLQLEKGTVLSIRYLHIALEERQKGHAMYSLDAQMHATFQARSVSSLQYLKQGPC